MAPNSTQTLRAGNTRYLPGNMGRQAHKADNVTAICNLIVYTMWQARCLTTLLASTPYYRDSFTFIVAVVISVSNSHLVVYKFQCNS
jgi:hypothetical protein